LLFAFRILTVEYFSFAVGVIKFHHTSYNTWRHFY